MNFNMTAMVTSLILERNHLTPLNGTINSEPAIDHEASIKLNVNMTYGLGDQFEGFQNECHADHQ